MANVDAKAFGERLSKLYASWESTEEDNQWSGMDALVVVVGRDDVLYSKSTALQTWLFGYELTDTLCVFCANEIHVLTSKKKADFLTPVHAVLKGKKDLPTLKTYLRSKDDDTESLTTISKAIKNSKAGKTIGVFAKDSFAGDFVEACKKNVLSVYKQVDVSAAFAYVSAPKDESELDLIKKACQITCNVFSKHVKKEIVTIVDEEKRVKHSKIADEIDHAVQEKKFIPAGLDADQVEICYSPIIQSGGDYQLKFSTISSEEKLHFGTIICYLGIRYKSYCSNIVRTMFVQPTQEMQDNYEFLLSVYEKTLENLKDGVKLSDVYSAVYDYVGQQRPELQESFTKSVGFAMGIEFREGSLMIAPKCNLTVNKGMVFNINLGFSNLTNSTAEEEEGKTYAIFIGDTVLVEQSGPATELTALSKKKLSSIAIFLGNEGENGKAAINPDMLQDQKWLDRTRKEMTAEEKRKTHQSELSRHMNEQAKKRLLDGKQDALTKRPKLSSHVAYRHPSLVPRDNDIQNSRIFVDKKYEALILPIHGFPTPFHISTIKNISKSEEGEYTYLRINFFHPGGSLGRVDGVVFPDGDATFVKEISFRSSSKHTAAASNMMSVFQLIKEVQKKFRARESEKKELEGYVEQESLVLSTNKGNARLKDLYMRPVIGSRRVQGTLEAHVNGLRYTTLKGDKVDILYKNVKHAFFQPSKNEMIVLLHFHLKHPLIIGKKKHKDIQFYTEVGEIMTDLGRTQHLHDRDDLMAEQAERELRAKLDNAFDSFRKKVESQQQYHIDFEKPFRELAFHGVPYRSTVLLQPTTNCLVNLTEQPPFIIVLDELELVHFERVQFHMRNFDMVFVFKDYKRKVAMVSSIPMSSLDSIKEWFNSCDIKYTEGIQSLNWTKIMKTINDDPEGFFENGGWTFLESGSDNEEAGSGDEDSEGSDEYKPTSEEEEVGTDDDDSDEDYTSISENSESEDEDDGEDESEESGKDWDELEEEAKKADKEQAKYNEDDGASKRKRPVDNKGPNKKKAKH